MTLWHDDTRPPGRIEPELEVEKAARRLSETLGVDPDAIDVSWTESTRSIRGRSVAGWQIGLVAPGGSYEIELYPFELHGREATLQCAGPTASWPDVERVCDEVAATVRPADR